ncbi:hypothetical protein AHF37_03092 [Paragonimus kellicotti]|nr:hypothetical protein AHF37_03092 [Paragonimus kellicotti]
MLRAVRQIHPQKLLCPIGLLGVRTVRLYTRVLLGTQNHLLKILYTHLFTQLIRPTMLCRQNGSLLPVSLIRFHMQDETPLTDEPSLGAAVGFDLSANTVNSTPGEEAIVMDDGYNREEDDGDDDLYEISEESDSEQSICLDDYWMTPTEIATHVETLGLPGVQAEYNAVVRVKSEDPRSAFKHVQNREKNRYCDVFCFEDSRVHLRPLSPQVTYSSKKIPKAPTSPKSGTLHRTLSAPTAAKDLVQNYIHANWVDGYRQKNAFICTQGRFVLATLENQCLCCLPI